MNDFSELDDWDPMAEDFYNPVFNTYKDIQKSITHDLAKLYIRNIPKDYTEEQLLSLMSQGNRKVRHICLFPAKKYESTTAGIVGFYTEKMAEEALKCFSDHELKFKIEYATRKMTDRVILKQIELWMPVQKNMKVNPPQTKAHPPQSKKTNLPQSTKVNLPKSTEVNLPQSAKVNPLESTKANLPQSAKVNPLESTKANLPQSAKVNPLESTKANLPQSAKVNPLESTRANLPQSAKVKPLESTKVNLPQSTKSNFPKSKKAFKDENECTENLQPNQPPVSSSPKPCYMCGNQIGTTTFFDAKGRYFCKMICRRRSNLDLTRKLEAEKLSKVEEETATSKQSVEKTVASSECEEKKTVAPDPITTTKECMKTEEVPCMEYIKGESVQEWNRRRRQWIRSYHNLLANGSSKLP